MTASAPESPESHGSDVRPQSVGHILDHIAHTMEGDSVSLEDLFEQLRTRSFGGLFLTLAAGGLLPAINFVVGLFMVVPAYQYATGEDYLRLPGFLMRKRIRRDRLARLSMRVLKTEAGLNRTVRRRLVGFTQQPFRALAGLAFALAGFSLLVPLPLTGLLPCLGMAMMAVGILERDGLFMLIGTTLSLLGSWVAFRLLFVLLDVVG